MTLQIAFDTSNPHAQAEFWAALLGYEVEDNSAFVDQLVEAGRMPEAGRITRNGRSEFADVAVAVDPAGANPRLYFQKVPEPKTAKNRVHIDVPVGPERLLDEVARAQSLGATQLWFTNDRGPDTYTMQDPEGNEFCLC